MPTQQETIDYALWSPIDLLANEIRTQRQERIPVSLIVKEGALIDPDHAQNLADSMMGDREQISPATVRARLVEDNQVVYDVIDGFHRSEGKRIIETLIGKPQTLDTIVVYGCGDEELFDLRVLAASSVKSIKFARMAEWMKRSFLSTHWQNSRIQELASSEQITLSQVFSLTQFDSSGTHLHLNTEEVVELKAWAAKKSKQWGRPISTLMTEMRTVEEAAPDLVQRVRTGGGAGKGRKGVLTMARLEAITNNLPGDWESQRLFADLAIDKNIVAGDLDFLTWSYTQAREAYDRATMTKILTEPELLLNPQFHNNQPDGERANKFTVFQAGLNRRTYESSKKKRNTSPHHETVKEERVVDEASILIKHNIPEIVSALIKVIVADKPNYLTCLNLPSGEVILDANLGIIKFNDKKIELTKRETELMLTFSFLEGVAISDRLLTLISNVPTLQSTNEAFMALRAKIATISKQAAAELKLNKQNQYSWLKD